MSGIAEAIAIASCVAALISAYKDGSTIIEKIKQRRQTRGALPPTVYLEKSLEKGKNAIVEAVVEGREQFGPGYEFGDDVAIQALKDITIETQAALLSRLAAATEDDSITDFTQCIAASDRGRLQALTVLNQLFLRKQAEASQPSQPIQVTTQTLQNSAPQWGQPPVYSAPDTSPNSALPQPSPSQQGTRHEDPLGNGRRSRWPFRRRASDRSTPSIYSTEGTVPPIPSSNNHSRNTSSGLSSSSPTSHSGYAIPISPSTQNSTDLVEPGTNTNATPGLGIYTTNTFSTTGSRVSRSSSLQVPAISPLTDRGTFCKYSYYLRAGLKEDGLRFYDQSIAGHGNYRYKCKSTSCAFQCVARKPEGSPKWMIDDRVRTCHGIGFRWLFLAKSHLPRTSTVTEPKFRCLICTLSGDSSSIFEGHVVLLEHVLGHQGAHLGTTVLEGPLSFSNERARVDNEDFDINFPPTANEARPALSNVSPDASFSRVDTNGGPNWSGTPTREANINRETHWSDELIDHWADPND